MDFSEIYEKYVRDVHRFALYLSGNPALAEDLTSETFAQAFCGHSDLRLGTVKAYLFASHAICIVIISLISNEWFPAMTYLNAKTHCLVQI